VVHQPELETIGPLSIVGNECGTRQTSNQNKPKIDLPRLPNSFQKKPNEEQKNARQCAAEKNLRQKHGGSDQRLSPTN
jgi:hypothetical protein